MDKIKGLRRSLSLRRSIVLYISAFAAAAIILSGVTAALCDRAEERIYGFYPTVGEKYYLTNENGEQLGEGTYIYKQEMPLNKKDEVAISVLEFISVAAAPVYSALCIGAAAFLFYRNKLKAPLAQLREASEKISNNDLEFTIEYDSGDELGELCASFEMMRRTLSNNFSEMWRQVEERKRLNAAFAHDLRTPLTVLKGYSEMLQTSEHIQTRETAEVMGKHISRMESYVSGMSSLRRIEDMRPECKLLFLQPFLSSLYESAAIVCEQNGKTLLLQNRTPDCQLTLDGSLISQVCGNLISNAVRYARTGITLTFVLQDGGLLLSVWDDGKGFDKNSLDKAVEPYFTEETDRSEHFGLGLYICKLLCERHGGYLRIEPVLEGAKVSAFFRFLSDE